MFSTHEFAAEKWIQFQYAARIAERTAARQLLFLNPFHTVRSFLVHQQKRAIS